MLRFAAAGVGLVLLAGSSSIAQVIYEPVQYQYSAGGRTYYYGGADPRVHEGAAQQSQYAEWGRSGGWAFHSGRLETHREVATEPVRIYADQTPTWNARFFGYTADDARNQAYAKSPTYFRKRDLLKTAVRDSDGAWVVPNQPVGRGTIEIRPWSSSKPAAAPRKVTEPKPILIIPKHLLDRPLAPSQQQMATLEASSPKT